jgi:hypothetical protein
MWWNTLYNDSIPQIDLEREEIFFQMFDKHFLEVHEKTDLYNFCMNNTDFINIADYVILDNQWKDQEQFLWCLIPRFMRDLKAANILNDDWIEYIRWELLEKLLNHQVTGPIKRKVLKLVIENSF